MKTCPSCGGTGKQPGLPPQDIYRGCYSCGGSGKVPQNYSKPFRLSAAFLSTIDAAPATARTTPSS